MRENISVVFDMTSGYTTGIYDPQSSFAMNWVLENSDWGAVDGFAVQKVEKTATGVIVHEKNPARNLQLMIRKSVSGELYREEYLVTNREISDYFLTRDNFGIHYPFNCVFEGKGNLHGNSCVAHVWCGGDVAWMYAARPSGEKPYLVGRVREGFFWDYSLWYDVSRVKVGAAYRGDIVLHPDNCVIAPGETKRYVLEFSFSEETPDTAPLSASDKLRVCADQYSAFVGETILCRMECPESWKELSVFCGEEKLPYDRQGNMAKWQFSAMEPGDYEITVCVDSYRTWMRLHVLEPLETILRKRAEFIVEKQQYHQSGSALDGAYLIYDRVAKRQYYDDGFRDHNGGRERFSMGIVVARALQKRFDEKMMKSLQKHRAFVEREIFDTETGVVFDGERRQNGGRRAYDYPFVSTYYLEWYRLTGEVECLKNAVNILFQYYEVLDGAKQESPCMEPIELCKYLKKEGLTSMRERLLSDFLAHADRILANGFLCYSEEVQCTQGMFNGKVIFLCQAYLLSGDRKYLEPIPAYLKCSRAFFAMQPDFHTNDIAVRYWDLYWFGKSRTYGDTMPQWISGLAGVMYDLLSQVGLGEEYQKRAENNLKNNLCVFGTDGFGSAGYLLPYKVTQYSSKADYENPDLRPGVVYGHKYDDFANDQDWALYYAEKICLKEGDK